MSVAIFGSIFLYLSQGLPTSGAASPGVAKHSRLQISPELTCRRTFIGIEAASLQEKTKRTLIHLIALVQLIAIVFGYCSHCYWGWRRLGGSFDRIGNLSIVDSFSY